MNTLFDLQGKRALVTGATHGLGMAMAAGLAEAGADIIVNGTTPERMDKALDTYKKQGHHARGFIFDVTNEDKAKEHIDHIENEIGPIDILVNNAGIIKRTPLKDMEAKDYREVIDVDLVGPFIMAKHAVKYMIPRKAGKIINICSMMSELGRDTVGAYAAAKGGLKMLTRNMATEWARYNIQANGIGPGYFATSQTEPLRKSGNPLHEFIIQRTPAGRWGDPDDLKGTAVFLASKASDFINGQIIYVDGGILATIGKPSDEE
jgi:gluconate 5-dehydrogenase